MSSEPIEKAWGAALREPGKIVADDPDIDLLAAILRERGGQPRQTDPTAWHKARHLLKIIRLFNDRSGISERLAATPSTPDLDVERLADGVRYAGGNGTSDYWRGFNDGIDKLEYALRAAPIAAPDLRAALLKLADDWDAQHRPGDASALRAALAATPPVDEDPHVRPEKVRAGRMGDSGWTDR